MRRWYGFLAVLMTVSLAMTGCDSETKTVYEQADSTSSVSFSISEVTGADVGSWVQSDNIAVTGIEGTVTVTLSSGVIVKNGSDLGTLSTTMIASDTIAVKALSSTSYDTRTAAANLTIDGVTRTFYITTGSEDLPTSFSFTSVSDAELSNSYQSNTISILGLDNPPVSAVFNDGGNTASIYVNGVLQIDESDIPLDNGDMVYVIMASSPNYATTLSSILSIGSMSRAYSVSTMAQPVLTVSPATVSLDFGETQQLTTSISPSSLTYNVTWASSNTAIAGVNSSGLVTAVSSGTATITATATISGHANITKSIVVAVNSSAAISQQAHYTDTGVAVVDVVLDSADMTAYLANSLAGVSVIDINASATTFMTEIGSLDLPSYTEGLAISSDDTMLFAATGYDGLNILDVSTPATPALTGTYNTGYAGAGKYAWKVALSSDESIAYVAHCAGLDAIDITTPAAPALLDELNITGGDCSGVAMDEHPYDVVLNSRNKLAFLAYGTSGIQIISTIDPTVMDVNSTYTGCADAKSVALSLDDNYLFIGCGTDGVNVVNVSDSANPTDEANLTMINATDSAMDVRLSPSGSFLYVSADEGMMIVDVSTPTMPVMIAYLKTSGSAYATITDSSNTYFYTADGSNGLLKLQLTY